METVDTTRRSTRISFPLNSAGYVTKFAPHKALKLIVWRMMTFEERAVLLRVGGSLAYFFAAMSALSLSPFLSLSLSLSLSGCECLHSCLSLSLFRLRKTWRAGMFKKGQLSSMPMLSRQWAVAVTAGALILCPCILRVYFPRVSRGYLFPVHFRRAFSPCTSGLIFSVLFGSASCVNQGLVYPV